MTNDPIGMAAEYANRANDKYYEWVRLMLSLTTGSLAGLIALQDNYVPNSPNALYLLWGSWVSLAGSVLAAAVILRGEGMSLRSLSKKFAGEARRPSDGRVHLGDSPWFCEWAAQALPWLLAASLVLLCAFAIFNSTVSGPIDSPRDGASGPTSPALIQVK